MNWEDDKEIITQKYFELINLCNLELFGVIKEQLDESNQIFPIIKFILERLNTVLYLTETNKLWDAEIVLRSAFETTVKFIFITTSVDQEKDIKLKEYWNSLSEINSLKLSDQAKRNMRFFSDSEMHRFAYLPLILSEEKELALRQKWSKAERQKIEQKWSFTEMINQISKKYKDTGLEMILALGHGYRMSSHVIHGDETGIGIIEERESRSPEERDKAHHGHYLRLFSDALSICSLIGIETMAFLGLNEKRKFFFDNVEKLNVIEHLEKRYRGKVFDDPDYDKYR